MFEYYYEGYDAFSEGITDCPYAKGSEEANHWWGGWQTAHEDQQFEDSWL